ncbi:MAG: aspartate aminotransferase family protein, partial [Myxococcales bacterium]|nr:aspartate aminotransferase family protein [Myxococcales bacterium]
AGNSARMGAYLFEGLQRLRRHAIVGDVRGGMGLLCAIEIVRDRESRERFPKAAKLGEKAVRLMRKHRMLGRAGDIIPVAPPLCITRDEVDESVARLDSVLTELADELRAPGG